MMLREFIEKATAAFKPPTDPMLLDFSSTNRKPAYLKTDGKLSKQDIDMLLNSTGGIRVGNTSFIYNEENLKDAGKKLTEDEVSHIDELLRTGKLTKNQARELIGMDALRSCKDPVGPTYETPGKITGGILQSSRSEELHSKLLEEMHRTYLKKNADYGNSFEESLDKRGVLASVIQMEHKLNRLSNLVSNEDNQRVVDESIVDTVMDLANYAVMTGVWLVKQREGESKMYADNMEYTVSGADFDGDVVYPTNAEIGRKLLYDLEMEMLYGRIGVEGYHRRHNYIKKTYGID